jgi:hypothetical protein
MATNQVRSTAMSTTTPGRASTLDTIDLYQVAEQRGQYVADLIGHALANVEADDTEFAWSVVEAWGRPSPS